MVSAEKEYVSFSDSVYAKGAVEYWLGNIEKMMRKTLYDETKSQKENYPEDPLQRDEWFFKTSA
jgi:hypothetical protein